MCAFSINLYERSNNPECNSYVRTSLHMNASTLLSSMTSLRNLITNAKMESLCLKIVLIPISEPWSDRIRPCNIFRKSEWMDWCCLLRLTDWLSIERKSPLFPRAFGFARHSNGVNARKLMFALRHATGTSFNMNVQISVNLTPWWMQTYVYTLTKVGSQEHTHINTLCLVLLTQGKTTHCFCFFYVFTKLQQTCSGCCLLPSCIITWHCTNTWNLK